MNAERDWTQGYRDAWWYFRSGMAWQFLIWAMATMQDDDPSKNELAKALLPVSKIAQTRSRPNTQKG